MLAPLSGDFVALRWPRKPRLRGAAIAYTHRSYVSGEGVIPGS
jgi:hypothetical protein